MDENRNRFDSFYHMVEEELADCVPSGLGEQAVIGDAMAYSLLGAGKRIRAVMTLAFCEKSGGGAQDALPFACAVEMVHAYSLIHDDLPCMDDDDMRRGKPSSHIKFGEGMAVLAGDALLTHAFSVLCGAKLPPERIVRAASELSDAAGVKGMLGGQVIDLEYEGKAMDEALLRRLHALKTGAMIRAAARLGCIAAGAPEEYITAADKYASAVGLTFQIVDDILDVTSTTEELGKPAGSDAENNKTTFATLFGTDGARRMADELVEASDEALRGTPLEDEFFSWLSHMLGTRKK